MRDVLSHVRCHAAVPRSVRSHANVIRTATSPQHATSIISALPVLFVPASSRHGFASDGPSPINTGIAVPQEVI